ncbi:MAG: TetR/AcrR family transcriptional regulator [Spirochaetota bacterium]
MPRATRTPDQVYAVRDRILQGALDIMTNEGFENLSMRKLGKKLGMTAANIYNYFSRKDELYLELQTRGFEMLFEEFMEVYEKEEDPRAVIEGLVQAYFSFGIRYADYYDIMFNRPTPKYADYRGTDLEKEATIEKETAMQVAHLTVKVIEELREEGKLAIDSDPYQLMLEAWCTLHGVVTLYNSRVYQEVDENFERSIRSMLEGLISRLV